MTWPEPLARRFSFQRRLARGRSSKVVSAVDHETGRSVALKILHDHLVEEEAVRRRLRRELAAVRRLDHPAIVDIYDVVEEGDVVALVMEYVDGETVRDRVERRGALPWKETKRVIDDVLAGLQQAHTQGIWHRDLNAEHIMITADGSAKIVGFGMARVDELVALTMHTQVLGSLEAMAPERVLGMDYDGRADLYSVGAVTHEMLLGHPPADGTMRAAFSRAHADSIDVDDEVFDNLPSEARYVLERSLASDMGARFATADQMGRALDGHYDEHLWRRWTSRDAELCPQCEMPVIDGIDRCIDCGHELRRLIQDPGQGRWHIQIISPREAFNPDVWFEQNTEPDYLPQDKFDALMELLESFEDTKQVADWSVEYRWPPYILVDELTFDDAQRISELLDERSIPHRVRDNMPGRLGRMMNRLRKTSRFEQYLHQEQLNSEAYSRDAQSHNVQLNMHPYALLPNVIMYFPVVFLSGISRRGFLMGVVALSALAAIWWGGPWLGLAESAVTAGFVLFLASLVVTRLGVVPLKRRLGSSGDRAQLSGQPLMIEGHRLESVDIFGSDEQLPRRTGRVLKGCNSESVRRELYELIVLAVTVARRAGAVDGEALAELVDEILDVGHRLDDVVERCESESTSEVYAEIERLDSLIEACDDDSERAELAGLKEERRQRLADLERHDEDVLEATMLRSTLQMARGSLLDLLADDESGQSLEERVTLDFDEGPQTQLESLRHQLEARDEIHEELDANIDAVEVR